MIKSNNKNNELKTKELLKSSSKEKNGDEGSSDASSSDGSNYAKSYNSPSLSNARSTKAARNDQVKSERTSPLAEILRSDFLQDVRAGLKAKGHKVDALDKKQEMSERKRQVANANPEGAGGGPKVEAHPALPKPEGIADNFVMPDSETPEAAMDAPELQLKQKLSHSKKQTLKANAELKKKQKLQNTPRPSPSSAPRLTKN